MRRLIALSLVLASPLAAAHSAGITGFSGKGTSTCAACHSGGSFTGSASLTGGATTVQTGSTTTYTWTLTTNASANGLDAAASAGTLAVDTLNSSGANTQKVGTEITHTAPRAPTSGQNIYSYQWTAPATAGNRTLFVCFNQVNLNGASSGDGPPVCKTQVISVQAPATAPVAANDSYSTQVNTTRNVAAPGVLANDTDVNGDALTAALVTDVSHGTLTLNSDGSFGYTPAAAFTGMDSFTYKANDGALDSGAATVQINVTAAANTAPVANNDSYSTTEGITLNISAPGVLSNDTDADGNPLNAVLVTAPANGGMAINGNGSFTYTPNSGFSGADSFTYQANDGAANSAPATVSLTVTALPSPPPDTGGGGGGGGAPGVPLLALFAAAAALRKISRAA